MNNKIRLFYRIVGFILLIFLGVSYAWSIFIQPLETEFGWLRTSSGSYLSPFWMIFGLSICALACSFLIRKPGETR